MRRIAQPDARSPRRSSGPIPAAPPLWPASMTGNALERTLVMTGRPASIASAQTSGMPSQKSPRVGTITAWLSGIGLQQRPVARDRPAHVDRARQAGIGDGLPQRLQRRLHRRKYRNALDAVPGPAASDCAIVTRSNTPLLRSTRPAKTTRNVRVGGRRALGLETGRAELRCPGKKGKASAPSARACAAHSGEQPMAPTAWRRKKRLSSARDHSALGGDLGSKPCGQRTLWKLTATGIPSSAKARSMNQWVVQDR